MFHPAAVPSVVHNDHEKYERSVEEVIVLISIAKLLCAITNHMCMIAMNSIQDKFLNIHFIINVVTAQYKITRKKLKN